MRRLITSIINHNTLNKQQFTTLHLDYSASIGDSSAIETRRSNSVSCSGTSCNVTAEDGGMEATAVQDLIDLSASIDQTEVSLGSRGGFDTIAIASEFDVSGLIFDDTFTVTPPTATPTGPGGSTGSRASSLGMALWPARLGKRCLKRRPPCRLPKRAESLGLKAEDE